MRNRTGRATLLTAAVIFTRNHSVARVIEQRIGQTSISLDVALYRLNNPKLAGAVSDAARRGVLVRVIIDRRKYEEDSQTRLLLQDSGLPFRLLLGRGRKGSKMHHKFAILDGRTALTGSYNWTLESEEENYDHLVILQDPQVLEAYRREFDLLWQEAESAGT